LGYLLCLKSQSTRIIEMLLLYGVLFVWLCHYYC
jgi:hypothetical protein